MSAFEVVVTPPRIKNARKTSAVREPTQVVLAPFSAKSIVTFEDIPVTKTAKRNLHIHNPTDAVLKVLVTKIIKPEANAHLEWTSNEIAPNSYASLEIVWSPKCEWATREVLQFTDNRNFKKDVAVVLKSVDKSNAAKLLKKATSRQALDRPVTKKLTIKSPSPRTKQRARIAAATLNAAKRNNAILSAGKTVDDGYQITKKVLGSQNYATSTTSSFQSNSEYYRVDDGASGGSFSAEKENRTPSTPSNTSTIFDTLRFTPLASNNGNGQKNNEFLASLPTPTAARANDNARRVISNTTLQSETFDMSFDLVNVQETPKKILNVTTTANERTPQIRVNNHTAVLSNMETPQARDEIDGNAPESQQTPVIVYHRHYETVNVNYHSVQTTTHSTVHSSPDTNYPSTPKLNHGRNGALSPHMNRTFEHDQRHHISTANHTRVLSPAPDHLYVIQEERSGSEMSETFVTSSEHQRTFNVVVTPENLAREVNMVGTPLRKKFQSMKELNNTSNNMSLEQQILRNNQGSMPNLHKLEHVKSIENNRYFYQSIEKDLPLKPEHENQGDTSICSMKSCVSTQSVAFQEHEILAQSSRFNLNEIGGARATSSDNKPTSSSYSLETNGTCDNSFGPLAAARAASKQPCKDQARLNVSGFGRKSVIASTGNPFNSPFTPSKKRVRDENVDLSRRSLNKQSPPKRVCMDQTQTSPRLTKGQSFRTKTWGGTQPKKFRVPKVPVQRLVLKKQQEERVILYDPDLHLRGVINPDPFAATTTLDPFLSATMFLDERSVDKHEIQFKKWLNALVTIPDDMGESSQKVDLGRLFNEVRNKDVSLAPTKETVSSNYLTKNRLDSLRKAAIHLYTSNEMRESLEKLLVHIEKKSIQIRLDRNLHLDVVLQRDILELLLNFNPLWLRLGLEVVFGELINMQSNQDIVSLSTFVINRLFRDKYLEAKYPKVYAQTEVYAEHIKKFTLKRVLCLIYFLDVAKNNRIIHHNPCLFLKSSPHKKTKDILLKFSSSLLANVGDIQRDLRRIGIVLTHEQTYIDEFDYAFRNLAIDLRDGVRLTKVMEIILLRDDMTKKLRVPAISRTQRVHNVGLALKSLENADFKLTGNITAADIVDGHREKTLSLLWQIIYTFRAPKFHAAATVIQNWWRNNWLKVYIKRCIRARKERIRVTAAIVIQAAYRAHADRKFVQEYREHRNCAALVIQTYVRRHLAIQHFMHKKNCIVHIQKWYRGLQQTRVVRQQFHVKRTATTTIQRWYRKILLSRKIVQMAEVVRTIQNESKQTYRSAVVIQRRIRAHFAMQKQRLEYLELRMATVTIQRQWKSILLMRQERRTFIETRVKIVHIQRIYRAYKAMNVQRTEFVKKKRAACSIQTWFRACQLAKKQRQDYVNLRRATLTIQSCVRATLLMQKERSDYQTLKLHATNIQRRFRARQMMIAQKSAFGEIRTATMVIQARFRAMIEMRKQKAAYGQLKAATIVIQQRLRATFTARGVLQSYIAQRNAAICLQQQFRAKIAMKEQRTVYLEQRNAAIRIQRHFKAVQLMRVERERYSTLRSSTIIIQQRFRATQLMRTYSSQYIRVKEAIDVIQRRWMATLQMKGERQQYLKLVESTKVIQTFYRSHLLTKQIRANYLRDRAAIILMQHRIKANLAMKRDREQYQSLRKAAVVLQNRFRANQLMREAQKAYADLRQSAIVIQRQLRAINAMRTQRQEYTRLKSSAIVIQQWHRAVKLMRQERADYLEIQRACVTIQIRYRSLCVMRTERQRYTQLRTACITIQQRFRANRLARMESEVFTKLLAATLVLQRRFRAKRAMEDAKKTFDTMRSAAVVIQTRLRATLLMKKHKIAYEQLKKYTTIVQRRFKANRSMTIEVQKYKEIKRSIICIQSHVRAVLAMRRERSSFLQIRTATICIQQHLSATLLMREERKRYLLIRSSAIYIQQRYRSTIITRHKRVEYLMARKSIISIQKFYRGYRQMQVDRQHFMTVRLAVLTIQQRYTAHKLMVIQRENYLSVLKSTKTIQSYYRSYQMMRTQRSDFVEKRLAAIKIQQYYRGHLEKKRLRAQFLTLRRNVVTIQQLFRANVLMKQVSNQYKLVKCLVICIQRKFRANVLMRQQREQYQQMQRAAIVLQNRFRAKKNGDIEHKRYVELKRIVVLMQAQVRGRLARERFQSLMTPEMIEMRRQQKAAKLIQSFWRGYRVRRNRSKKLKMICENAKRLQRNVVRKNILRNRIQGIIRFLKERFNVNEALNILKELEFISRTVPHTLIDESKFIAYFCYGIMSQAIRSEVDKQLISLCCQVILNLARYEPTKENAFQIQNFETVAQILARWCDKDCDIFNILCTVIWVFVQCPSKNEQIREFMFTREAIYLLRETKKLTIRKENMKRNVKQNISPILSMKEMRQLPRLETNFGVNKGNKDYIFNSSVFALDTILSKLNITI